MTFVQPWRLRSLPLRTVRGVAYPVAETPASRLLGLAFLNRDRAGPGLLLPRCRSVHTFGMRFELDVIFLDDSGLVLARHDRVAARRVLLERRAAAALERPSGEI